jgi:hypothetical protein
VQRLAKWTSQTRPSKGRFGSSVGSPETVSCLQLLREDTYVHRAHEDSFRRSSMHAVATGVPPRCQETTDSELGRLRCLICILPAGLMAACHGVWLCLLLSFARFKFLGAPWPTLAATPGLLVLHHRHEDEPDCPCPARGSRPVAASRGHLSSKPLAPAVLHYRRWLIGDGGACRSGLHKAGPLLLPSTSQDQQCGSPLSSACRGSPPSSVLPYKAALQSSRTCTRPPLMNLLPASKLATSPRSTWSRLTSLGLRKSTIKGPSFAR